MFTVQLILQNKMLEAKTLYQSLNLIGNLSLVITLPWIIFKVFRSVYLKNRYKDLRSKVVVITGASSGLGEALAHEFYKCGCVVVLCARRRQELERVRGDLLQLHATVPTVPPVIVPLDLSDINTLPNNVNKIISIVGHIDILINNGGVSHRGTVSQTKVDVDIKIMLVNYFGSVAVTKAVLPHMLKRQEGHIIFVSSIQGLVALPERSAYSASKHALQAFSDSLRAEVADQNIFVTVVSPGYIKTKLSLNALTGSGSAYGQMDATTESGYSPEYVAEKMVKTIAQKENELIISTLLPKIAVYLRKFFPTVYFYVMARRARKTRNELKMNVK